VQEGAGIEQASGRPLRLWCVNSSTSSRSSVSARPACAAASNAFIVGPEKRRKRGTNAAGASSISNV
jgi:hypothetical protein